MKPFIRDCAEIYPQQYIQNRRNWCWAVACKILGQQYKYRHPQWNFSIVYDSQDLTDLPYGMVSRQWLNLCVPTEEHRGLRLEMAGCMRGVFTVDAWQRAIVMNASGFMKDEDISGDDQCKVRGMKYVITGNPCHAGISISTKGYYESEISVFEQYHKEICKTVSQKKCILANVMLEDYRFHTLIIMGMNRDHICLYDPWDGLLRAASVREVFDTGFQSSLGKGIVKWIQYIKE